MGKLNGDEKKLSTKFWTTVYEKFALVEHVGDSLPEPTEELPVDPNLLLAMKHARSGNPAGDPAAPLESYLAHCDVLNRCELWGLLRAVEEGPQLAQSIASKCQVALMAYFSRTVASQAPTY